MVASEQVPTTFGCAHAQQIIWRLIKRKDYQLLGIPTPHSSRKCTARTRIDKGIRIGSWGQLQEWKFDQDSPSDAHRHLSHLIGLYPGYAIASYDPTLQGPVVVNGANVTYTKDEVIDAATTSLIHSGNGTGPNADSGWEKAWRAAAYAQLGDATTFYHILTYCIQRNFGPNLFSLYNPMDPNPIFQIDANLAYPAALMNALLQAPDVPTLSTPITITLLPALPRTWSKGSVRGGRVRGGITIDFAWQRGKLTKARITVDQNAVPRNVRVVYCDKVIDSFLTAPGMTRSVK